MADLRKEIEKRRTFAIISHPDAGKTTLTEKFLLYGGAINLAGSVKGKATARHAVSDWMEIEKERGISVTSSVLQFNYGGYCINILDTPGHQDFSEDTYRTLMAADSAVMVIDGSKGVEAQTRKLFKVCVMRHIPIFTFINKMDRDANDTFDLLDEIEKELGIATCPVNWPIGSGKNFKGVYDRNTKKVMLFSDTLKGTKEGEEKDFDIFGNVSEDKTKIKKLKNNKHRENEKNKFEVLGVNLNTELSEFIEKLRDIRENLESGSDKIDTPYDLPVYKASNQVLDTEGFDKFSINPWETLNNLEKIATSKETNLYKINVPENTKLMFFSNIAFYENDNHTLPLGMDVSQEILINLDLYTLELKNKTEFNMNISKDEFTNYVKNVKVYEYNLISKK